LALYYNGSMDEAKQISVKMKEYFSGRNDIAFAFLFGSWARGTVHKHSDIDIAVYFYPQTKFPVEYEGENYYPGEDDIWADLDRILGIEVELMVLNRAAASVAASAILGKPLMIKDWDLYLDFMAVVSREAEDYYWVQTRDFLDRSAP